MTELPLYLAVCAQNATPTYNGPDCEKRRRPVAGRRHAPQDASAPRPARRRPIRKPKLVKLAALALASVCAIGLLAGCSNSSSGAPATNNGEHPHHHHERALPQHAEVPGPGAREAPRNQPGDLPLQRRKHQRIHAGIFFNTVYTPGHLDDENDFLDMSGLDFTDNYVQSRLREVTPNGGAVSLDVADPPCNVPGSERSETRSSTH